MNKVIFRSEETNLGRFGTVKSGDVLVLTDQEAGTIAGDKRFEIWKEPKDKSKAEKPGQFIKITDQMTPLQKEVAEKQNKDEQARLDQLAKANDEEAVKVLEIKTLSFEKLAEMAEEINAKENGHVIDIGKRTSKPELIRQILIYMRDTKGVPIEEEDDPK